jgi:flagellar biosynthesis protein FlhA
VTILVVLILPLPPLLLDMLLAFSIILSVLILMTALEAVRTYTLLTVGDGLVTQVPALSVSTAAGLLVSKAGVTGAADQALLKQLSGYPKALGMSSAVMVVMALLPGIPMLPFLLLGGGAGALAFVIDRRTKRDIVAAARKAEAQAKAEPAEEPITAALKIDDLKIELGYALLPLVNSTDGNDRLTNRSRRCAARSPARWAS